MSSRKHRLIWESVNGPIPKDLDGRSYEVHHIDGNHNNNEISNLQLVTIQEHYNIHFLQEDWNACVLIGLRMSKSPVEISKLNSMAAKKRIKDGTHHFLKGGPREDMMGDKNPMRKPEIAKKVSENSKGKPRNWTSKRTQADLNRRGIKLQLSESGLQRKKEQSKKIFTLNNPSNTKITCVHCNRTMDKPNHNRWHGDNCKDKQ